MLRLLFLLFYVSVHTLSVYSEKTITVLNCCDEAVCPTDSLPTIYSFTKKSYLTEKPPSWTIKTIATLDCGNLRLESVESGQTSSFVIVENGLLLLTASTEKFTPNKYCYVNSKTAMYCTDKPKQIKVKKCCGDGAVFSETKNSCMRMNVTDYKIDIPLPLVDGFPRCKNLVNAGKLHEAELLPNGSLLFKHLNNTLVPNNDFCLEHVFENAVGAPSILTCDHLIPKPPPEESDVHIKILAVLLLLSAIFLAATLVAGATLPQVHHHALHWRCQTNHVACLMVGDILLAITQLAGRAISPAVCVPIATIMHFSFLSAFFWLNTMCFNIWWTFRDLRPGTLEKRQERCRLRIYGVYAWGIPLLIAMIGFSLDRLPHGPDYTFLRPGFGEKSCWFPSKTEEFAFFFAPLGILLFINLILFAATARELTCGLWKRELVKSTTERAALGRVCMKLVIVMGVTWIADVLSWAIVSPREIWYITDVINALQGVFIFIVVACQPQVWSAIKRLWCRRQSLAADITGNGNPHSSSSHGLPSYGDSVTNHSCSNTTNTTRSVPVETSC